MSRHEHDDLSIGDEAADLIASLREALEPFAKMGELADFAFAPALFHDRDEIKHLPWRDNGHIVTITYGDLRRARAALAAGEGGR